MQTLTQRRSVPVDAAKTAAIFGTLLIHASAAGGFAGAPGSFGWTSALFWNCLLRSAVPVFPVQRRAAAAAGKGGHRPAGVDEVHPPHPGGPAFLGRSL